MSITNIIEPKVFASYVREKTLEKSRIIASGAVKNCEGLAGLASGGGRTVNMPFWNRISGESEVLSKTAALSPTPVTAGTDTAAINYRGKAWSARELGSALAGDSAVSAVADMVADYWAREEQKLLVAALTGAFASPGMEGHVYGAAKPAKLNAAMVLDAKQLLGDAFGRLQAIVMHSVVYTALQKQDLITFIRPSADVAFGQYLGYNVIVDDTVPFDQATGVYSTYLLADGVIARGDGSPVDFTQAETYRDGLKGEDFLIFRKALILHPYGVAFTGENVAGVSPENSELCDPINWNRVYEKKNVGMVEIRHTVG